MTARQATIETLAVSIQALEQTKTKLTEDLSGLAEEKALRTSEISEARILLTRLKGKLESVEEQCHALTEQLKSESTIQKTIEEEIHHILQEITTLEMELTNIQSGQTTASEQYETTAQTIRDLRATRMRLHEQVQEREGKIRKLKSDNREELERLHEQELKTERLDGKLENRIKALHEKHNLSFEGAKARYGVVDASVDVEAELRFLRERLSRFGTINLAAIEEYDRLHERVTFLTQQQADMLEAKETLLQIIEQMDDEMKKRFGETFEQIQSHFNGVFSALFGGGRARLELTDPDNLLETGVDIIAEPPGKKLQNLNLMSGGEKALTAIALLFSILKVRPVPFSILDEVEAALDEANVIRFARYLKQLQGETQFIVITHRKGTMTECDVLYGVTMQEDGISRLVSVQFDQEELQEVEV
ncbi:MAG: hypothetical protein ACRC5C_13415 [Bacilli bacterium]